MTLGKEMVSASLRFLFELPLACSGPGALLQIFLNQGYSRLVWYGTIGITACSLLIGARRRKKWLMLPGIAASVFHPAWTTSATRGDCGTFMFAASRLLLVVTVAMLFAQLVVYYREEEAA